MRFAEIPLVRIVVPFSTGILVYALGKFHFPLSVLLILVTTYLLLYFFLRRQTKLLFRIQSVKGILLIGILCVGGNQLAFFRDDINDKHHYINQKDYDYARVTLCEPLVKKENSYKAIGEIDGVMRGDASHAACGTVILYFSSETIPALG